MSIRDMSVNEITAMLDRVSVGCLACADSNIPYVVPLRFVHSGGYLYALSTKGKKISMMQSNKHVCINFTEITDLDSWKSLVVHGSFEEILPSNNGQSLHGFAHKVLSHAPEWWVPAYTRTVLRGEERPLEPVFFRISILETTGHVAER